MDWTTKLFSLVNENKLLWLDLTEKCIEENSYKEAINVIFDYKDKKYTWIENPQNRWFNSKILEKIMLDANHLMDYIKKCAELNRVEFTRRAEKILLNYATFAEYHGASKNSDGYYKVEFSQWRYENGYNGSTGSGKTESGKRGIDDGNQKELVGW